MILKLATVFSPALKTILTKMRIKLTESFKKKSGKTHDAKIIKTHIKAVVSFLNTINSSCA